MSRKSRVQRLRVSKKFKQFTDGQLMTFGYNVADNLDETLFPSLLVPPKEIGALTDTFTDLLAATIGGGKTKTAAKNKAREALLKALNLNANTVTNGVGNDLELLLGTGYQPVSKNRARTPLAAPAIRALENCGSTQLLLRLARVRNARMYLVQISPDGGGNWLEAIFSKQARRIVLQGLIPGTTYTVRARAIGGSTGSSDWSAPQSHIST